MSLRKPLGDQSVFEWTAEARATVERVMLNVPAEKVFHTQSRRLNALHIGGSMWADYYLRPDGDVVVVGEDFDHPDVDTVHSNMKRALEMLVWGSRRYPELASLLPVRDPEAVDCRCQKIPLFAEGKVICPECSGLGWVLPS